MRQSRTFLVVLFMGAIVLGLSAANLQAYSDTWTGAASTAWDTTSANWTGGNGSLYTAGDAVTFDDSAVALHGTVNLPADAAPGSINVTNTSGTYTLTGSYGIIGSTTLTKSGGGTLILDNTRVPPPYVNSYTGATTVNGGLLQIGNYDGNWQGTIGYSSNSGSPITVNSLGTVEFYQTDLSNHVFNAFSGSGNVVLQGNAVPGAGHTYNSDYDLYANSPSFNGTATVNYARVYPQAQIAMFGSGTINVTSGGTVMMHTSTVTQTATLEIAGNGWLATSTSTPSGALCVGAVSDTWSGNVILTNNAGITAYGSSSVGTITGPISGNYQLAIRDYGGQSQGTIVLQPSGTNTYGSTYIKNDVDPTSTGNVTLKAGSAGAFSTGALLMEGYSATRLAVLQANGFSFSFADLASNNAFAQIKNGSATTPAVITVGSDGTSTAYSGTLVNGGTAALGLIKTGGGLLTLSGANTYTGDTTVNGGTLSLSQAYLASASNVWIGSGDFLNLTFGSTDTIGSLYLNGVEQPAGVYGAGNSGGYITGTGSLLVTVGAMPEPGTLALLACGLAGLLCYAWRKRR